MVKLEDENLLGYPEAAWYLERGGVQLATYTEGVSVQ